MIRAPSRQAVRLLVLTVTLLACAPSDPGVPEADSRGAHPRPLFSDATEHSGLRFVHFNDATSQKLLPETMGAGVALFDFDGDGWTDIYLVNGMPLGSGRPERPVGVLFRNRGDGTFEEVTDRAGLVHSLYGMGAAVGDLDNSGDLDLFVSGVGRDLFYRNRGDGTFEEVGAELGLQRSGFGQSAAFVDLCRDGFLDLFVGRYVTWSLDGDIACSPDRTHRVYCTPEVYAGETNRLYRNEEGLRLVDVTANAGIELAEGKGLGVAVLDLERDGWPDLAVANDTVRNFLFVNQGDGTFLESGIEAGVAFSASGAPRGGMGIDAGDLTGNGLDDIVIGNFSQEMAAFFRALAPGVFVDDAARAGIGLPTLMTLAFGALILDVDGDGTLDVLLANGHIEPEIERTHPHLDYAQPLQLFLNLGDGAFREVHPPEAGALAQALVGRGLAAADFERRGSLDLVVTQNGRSARLLRNESPPSAWLRLELEGTKSNRTGYGALVTATAGPKSWVRSLTSGGSYLSASEPALTLRFGDLERLDRLEIVWPSGRRQVLVDPPLNRSLRVVEPLVRDG